MPTQFKVFIGLFALLALVAYGEVEGWNINIWWVLGTIGIIGLIVDATIQHLRLIGIARNIQVLSRNQGAMSEQLNNILQEARQHEQNINGNIQQIQTQPKKDWVG